MISQMIVKSNIFDKINDHMSIDMDSGACVIYSALYNEFTWSQVTYGVRNLQLIECIGA